MTRILGVVLTVFLTAVAAQAQQAAPALDPLVRPAEESDLSEFLWINRPIVVFADTPADPRFQQQIDMLQTGDDALHDRDVVVLVDTDPTAQSPLRQKLRPRGFQVVLIGKDGSVILRKPSPWSVRELSRSIDKMPLREREVRDRRNSNSD